MITAGAGKAPIQAKAMDNYANGIQWYPPIVLPNGGNAPLSRSDAGIALLAPMPKAASNKLVILPNPASGQVTIRYALDLETTRAVIEITDIEGKTIILLPVSDFKGEIQLADSRLLPGIYAVRLLVDDFPVRTQKLVIIK
ncbi:MAG: T9SS type A sorting domain-containing protein [Saprospiraceae bacterium]|nr:T9SS type A sorting domain-containing protein [Saprospiraceae bacterium]